MANDVFLDTSFIVSLFNNKDSNHSKALLLQTTVLSEVEHRYISSFVYAEYATILSQRLGKEEFVKYQKFFQAWVQELFIDAHLHGITKKYFETLKNKDISFVDASSILAMKKYKIKHIVTFGKHFGELERKFGVKIIC